MSMSEYALVDKGLLIADEITAFIVLAEDKENDEIPDEVQAAIEDGTFLQKVLNSDPSIPEDYLDTCIAQEILEGRGIETVHCSEFTGGATTMTLPGDDETIPRTWDYQDRFMAYIPAKGEPDLFKPAYNHPDDLIKEMRETLEGILPENFNIRPYLADINGTYIA